MARMDEADRVLHSAFSGAANSLSQLYTQSVALQKDAFLAGELQALGKLSEWMRRKLEEGSSLTVADIMAHIEREMDNGESDAQGSPRVHGYPQNAGQIANSGYHQRLPGSRGSIGEHSKSTAMFSNARSSPVCEKYHHPTRGGGFGKRGRIITEANSASLDDISMDMVEDYAKDMYR
ncbi:unnamed protein product [Alopecurus aequalis]